MRTTEHTEEILPRIAKYLGFDHLHLFSPSLCISSKILQGGIAFDPSGHSTKYFCPGRISVKED